MIVFDIRMHLRLNTPDTSEYVCISFEMKRHTRNAINYWLESVNCSTFFSITFRLKKSQAASVIDVNVSVSSDAVSNENHPHLYSFILFSWKFRWNQISLTLGFNPSSGRRNVHSCMEKCIGNAVAIEMSAVSIDTVGMHIPYIPGLNIRWTEIECIEWAMFMYVHENPILMRTAGMP